MSKIENYTDTCFGGLNIITESSKDKPYHIRINCPSPNEIWSGSPADLEDMLNAYPTIVKALKELIFLHSCEQEGIGSGQPTAKQWLKAVDDGVNALEKAGIDLSAI